MPVAALATADEKNDIVVGCEVADMGHTVGHLSADGVGKCKGCCGGDVLLYVFYYVTKDVKWFGCLAVETDIAGEVQPGCIIQSFDDNCRAAGLSYEAKNFCVARFAEDDNLSTMFRV